jgi:hypothetical protein
MRSVPEKSAGVGVSRRGPFPPECRTLRVRIGRERHPPSGSLTERRRRSHYVSIHKRARRQEDSNS